MTFRYLFVSINDTENFENLPREVKAVYYRGVVCLDVAHHLCSAKQEFWLDEQPLPYAIELAEGVEEEQEFEWAGKISTGEFHEMGLRGSSSGGDYYSRNTVLKFWTPKGDFEGTFEQFAEKYPSHIYTSEEELDEFGIRDLMEG